MFSCYVHLCFKCDSVLYFRNLCLSLAPTCNRDNVLLLWEHECYWMYGHRMINEVDYDRFRQAFIRLIRKDFTSEEHVRFSLYEYIWTMT